jgi:hypothetical protein
MSVYSSLNVMGVCIVYVWSETVKWTIHKKYFLRNGQVLSYERVLLTTLSVAKIM